ncbi:ABC transporter ATP-binding protein [Candidatus Parcubacteria bacterium]|nr:MAG: ABC transporter ATP-binding protein [Candidatus Parcubacteria bacterium]
MDNSISQESNFRTQPQESQKEPIIRVKNLNFIYNKGKSNEFQALVNVSFEVYPQEFIILFGPSGCGKSTILNIISGLEPPEKGHVFVYGKDMGTLSKREFAEYHRRKVGMIYQAYNLINSLTVLDNVALPQIFLSVRKKVRERRALELLDRFGIRAQAKKIPMELSGGQQQRIGVARAIINDPDIILADEPVGNLDSVSARNVLEILKDLNEKDKKTIILVTHNPEYLEYGDRIFHLKDGTIIKETINHDKGKIKKKDKEVKAPTSALQDIMRAYSGLSPEQINILIMPYKAKVFAQHFITTRNLEETKIFEDLMHRRLLGTITSQDFYNILHRPYAEGGVGFSSHTAEKIVHKVEEVMSIAKLMGTVAEMTPTSLPSREQEIKNKNKERTEKALRYLLKSCFADYKHQLEEERLNRLRQAIFDRISNKINKPELFNILDKPFKEGGVGLNSKTARAVTEELELILILGYGLAERREQTESKSQTPSPQQTPASKTTPPQATKRDDSTPHVQPKSEQDKENNKDAKDSEQKEGHKHGLMGLVPAPPPNLPLAPSEAELPAQPSDHEIVKYQRGGELTTLSLSDSNSQTNQINNKNNNK